MNREQLSDAIGRLDDDMIAAAGTSRRRRPWWTAAVAVAACVCMVVGAVTVWPILESGQQPGNISISTGPAPETTPVPDATTTTTETSTTTEKSTVTETSTTVRKTTTRSTTRSTTQSTTRTTSAPVKKVQLLASPNYPNMVQKTNDNRSAWQESRNEQKAKIAGQTGGMTDFYTHTIATFLQGDPGENRVYSPLNVYLALSMLAEVTEGNSRKQLTDLLGASDLSALRKKNAALWNGVYIDDGVTVSRLGNSLWLANDGQYQYDTDTVNNLAKYYYASVYKGTMGSDAYDKELQNWVNDQTDGLLKDQAQGLKLDEETVLALVSTICFKAGWVGEFSEYSTEADTFHAAGGKLTRPFMNTSVKTTAYFGKNYTAVAKDLDDGSFKMVFFLPDEDSSVDELICDPQMVALLEGNTGEISRKTMMVNMSVPKFDVASEYPLDDGLKALGVTDVFSGSKSNFGGILKKSDDLIVGTTHAARVKIDEEGAEAAAYTMVTVAKSNQQQIKESLDFKLDRPFVFAITGPENTILFTGVVEDP